MLGQATLLSLKAAADRMELILLVPWKESTKCDHGTFD